MKAFCFTASFGIAHVLVAFLGIALLDGWAALSVVALNLPAICMYFYMAWKSKDD